MVFLYNLCPCSSAVSLLSISIYKSFSLHALESFSLQISTWWVFLSLRKRWNLSALTFIQLLWNHKERVSVALLINSDRELPIASGELSSALLTKSVFGLDRRRSQKKTSKISGSIWSLLVFHAVYLFSC